MRRVASSFNVSRAKSVGFWLLAMGSAVARSAALSGLSGEDITSVHWNPLIHDLYALASAWLECRTTTTIRHSVHRAAPREVLIKSRMRDRASWAEGTV